MINHVFGFLTHPRQEWQNIRGLPEESLKRNLPYAMVLAVFPALAWYLGTTRVGWGVGGDDPSIRITSESAMSLAGAFYVTMVIAVTAIGYFIHWMAHTYGAKSNPIKGIVIAGFTATPVFIAGIAGIYPVFWFDIILGTLAVAYSLYLLYVGIPIVMDIPPERGFLFASAVVAVALVIVIAVMGATVIFWEFISAPVFVRQ